MRKYCIFTMDWTGSRISYVHIGQYYYMTYVRYTNDKPVSRW